MTKQAFDDFIRQQTASSTTASIDWGQKLSEWQQYLAQLYALVESLLEKYIRVGKIEVGHKKKTIHEDLIGAYEVDVLTVSLGK